MIEWTDEGLVLRVRQHGETAAVVELLTARHGRHAGVVRGGVSRRLRPVLQPGSVVEATWRARLDEHIGAYTIEPVRSSAPLFQDRAALAGLSSAVALLSFALAERDPQPDLYAATQALLSALGGEGWPAAYLRWELGYLQQLGYGLDLTRCAVTGRTSDLAFVSPRTGRAVSRKGAAGWEERLLPLPPCLGADVGGTPAEVTAGLRTTSHFLETRLAADLDRPLPPARARLVELLARVQPAASPHP